MDDEVASQSSAGFEDPEESGSRVSSPKENTDTAAADAAPQNANKAATQDEEKPEIVQDPYYKAMDYLEEHNIITLFQRLTAAIVFERPADPVQFIMDKAEEIADSLDDKEVQRLRAVGKK